MDTPTYTYEQIGARVRSKDPEKFASFSDKQIGERVALRNPNVASLVAPQQQQSAVIQPQQEEPKKVGLVSKIGNFLTSGTQAFAKTLGAAAATIPDATGLYSAIKKPPTSVEEARNIFASPVSKINTANLAEAESNRKLAGLLSRPDVSELQKERIRSQLGQGQQVPLAEQAIPELKKTARQVYGEGALTGLEAISGGGLEALGKGVAEQGVKQAIVSGAKTGAIYGGLGGSAQAAAENRSIKDIALSGAESAVVGAGISGAASGAFKAISNKLSSTNAVKKAEEINRNVLNQTKGELAKAQVKELAGRGTNVPKLMAEEGIIIGNTADGKLDTTGAIRQVKEKLKVADSLLSEKLRENPSPFLSLADTRNETLFKIDKMTGMVQSEKNALKKEIESIFNQEIEGKAGPGAIDAVLNGEEANNLKSALYQYTNYDNPKVDKGVKVAANSIKTQIENFIEMTNAGKSGGEEVRSLNKRIGDLATLQGALTQAEGRVVRGGSLGQMAARGAGAVIGSTIPIPVVGSVAGYEAGGALNKFLLNPERRTAKAAKLIAGKTLGQRFAKTTLPKVGKIGSVLGKTAVRKVGQYIGQK